MRFSPAQRRYNRRILWLSLLYVLLLVAADLLFLRWAVSGLLAYFVGVLPAVPVSGFFWTMGRYLVDESDEYLRMLMIRQLLIATGIALTAETLWGILESFALLPHLVAWIWPVVWLAGLCTGAAINNLVERRAA